MTPRTIIDKERRRYEDDPGYTTIRWISIAVKIVAYALLSIFVVGGWNFMLDYRKDHESATDTRNEMLKNKADNIRQDLTLENHGVRINKLEGK